MWNKIRPENDKNRNDVPDSIDRAIISYIIWEIVKAILLLGGFYILGKVLKAI